MSKLTENLKKEIEANLPELVAGEMKEYIIKAEVAFKDVRRLTKLIDRLETDALKDQDAFDQLEEMLGDKDELERRIKNITKREKEIELEKLELSHERQILDIERDAMQSNSSNLHELVSMVCSNPGTKGFNITTKKEESK